MADGQAPDQTQALLQMQSLINSSRGNKASYGFGVVPLEWKATPFDMASCAPLAKNITPLLGSGTGGKPGGLADKFLQAFASMNDDFKKMAQNAGVMYSGDLPNGSLPGSGGGSGFASNIGPSNGNDAGIG